MNYKTTVVLMLLLALIGGYFYFVEYGQISGYQAHEQQRTAQSDQPLGESVFTEDAPAFDSIDRIEVRRGDREVVIRKQNDEWVQTQPVRFALSNFTPDAIARLFAELRYVQRFESASPGASDSNKAAGGAPTFAQMGLDKPRATVTVGTGDKSWTLKLGRLAVSGQGYVQVVGSDTAYVVDPALHGAVLDQPMDDWRSKSLGTFTAAGSDSITLKQRDGEVIELHKVDGRWRFGTKVIQRTSEEAIDELFASLSRVWIGEFVEDNPEGLGIYGLDNPYLEMVIQPPPPATSAVESSQDTALVDSITHRLRIGRPDLQGNSRYATWTSGDEPTLVVFTIDAATADSLTRSTDDLRDPRVLEAKTQDVRELTVRQGNKVTLHLLRDPQSGYRFGDPQPDFDIDYSTTQALLKQLCDLETTIYTTALDDLGEPIAQVQLGTATGTGEVNVDIYRTGDNHTFVTQGEGVGYVVEADDLVARLLGTPLGLRQRTVVDVSRDELAGITLRRADGVAYEFTPGESGSGWSLVGYERFEDMTLTALLDALNPLRASEWLDAPHKANAGVIELILQNKDETTHELSVDPTTGRAALPGADRGFVLPQSVVDLLNAEYRERSVGLAGIGQIESIKLSTVDLALTLSLNGQRYVSDQGEVDQALAAGVFDGLAGLRVQRYVAPLHLRPQDIDFSIELTTTDGRSQTLRLVNSGDETVTVTMDPADDESPAPWFTLSRADADRLRAPLTDAEALIK
jgi:Domain of unknown function (DUF4340)